MKRILALCLASLLAGCAAQQHNPMTGLKDKVFEMPVSGKKQPSRSLEEVEENVRKLNTSIGGYPPRFNSAGHRVQVYVEWSGLLEDALAHQEMEGNSEPVLYVLSELYRQGHNLDVRGAADKASSSISTCLKKYPSSVHCHFSSAYFYLSVDPKYVNNAEISLSFLRDHFSPKVNYDVERNYVILYIFKRDANAAMRQIDYFVQQFPNSPDKEHFLKMRLGLEDGNINFKQM